MAKSNKWYGVSLAAVAGIGAYFLLRKVLDDTLASRHASRRVGGRVSAKVAKKLPLAKDLPTIPDVEGNYDIDGVSYDVEGVIVSSDENKHPVVHSLQHVVEKAKSIQTKAHN